MNIEIGSNKFSNTNGVIEIEGVPQIEITLKKPEGPLFVNFVIFDGTGRITAKTVNSSLAFNELAVYDVTRTVNNMTMKKQGTDTIVLEVNLKEPNHVVINKGEFLTAKAHTIEISPAEWKVDKKRSSWVETDAKGGAASIG